MDKPELEHRYGTASVTLKILWSLVTLAMIVLGETWEPIRCASVR